MLEIYRQDLFFVCYAVRRPAFGPACYGFLGASMSGPGSHPRSASLRSPPSASPKQRADKTARSLPGHLRIPMLATLAPGKPEKPPPHATILLVRCLYCEEMQFLEASSVDLSISPAAVGGGGWVNQLSHYYSITLVNTAVGEAFWVCPERANEVSERRDAEMTG